MDKDALLAKRLTTEELDVPDVGTIKIRALTRSEALQLGDKKNTVERERHILVCAMVDPEMTYQDVKAWQDNATPGELEVITTAIARLSGMLDTSAKEVTGRFPDDPEPGV